MGWWNRLTRPLRHSLVDIIACRLGVHPISVDWDRAEWACTIPWCSYRETPAPPEE